MNAIPPYKQIAREIEIRKFEREFCSRCVQDCSSSREKINKCMDMDEYDLMVKIHDGVSYTREEFDEELKRIEREQIRQHHLSKLKGADL